MEDDIVNGLTQLGYSRRVNLEKILNPNDSTSLVELSQVVNYLSTTLDSLCHTEETVHVVEKVEEAEGFCMELGGLLRELCCPYSSLMEGPPLLRLSSKDSRLKLLNFLVSECQAARMIQAENNMQSTKPKNEEAMAAEQLKSILLTLGFSKPPTDITANELFSKVIAKISELISNSPAGYPGLPLLKVPLTEAQWTKIYLLFDELVKDYKLRREMLLTRLDVTVLSFTWSSRVKDKLDDLSAVYQPLRSEMRADPNVTISQLLSAREEVGFMEKTSCAAVREKTKTPLQRMVIGDVPDRGGRPSEQRIPAKEMPQWQKRRADGGGRGGGGRGGGRGGGGRVQGGWNQGGSSWNQDQKSHWRGRGKRY